MENKHTPGPWEIDTDNMGTELLISNKNQVEVICSLYSDPMNEEQRANARLIAAAPAMKELLERLTALPYPCHPNTIDALQKEAQQLLNTINS